MNLWTKSPQIVLLTHQMHFLSFHAIAGFESTSFIIRVRLKKTFLEGFRQA